MSAEDAALWERWRARRDPDAFAELVTRHGSLVYATCRRILGNAAEAQDAAQECFLELAQSRRLDVGASLAPWLHTVALHRSLDRIKSEKRRRHREQRYAADQSAPARAELDDLLTHVDEAIAALPDDLRVPLVHRYLEGMTHDAIAGKLGLAESTIRYRLEKAAEQLRRFLARRGVRIGGAALAAILGGSMAEAAPASLTAVLGKVALAGGAPASWGASGTAATTLGGLLVMKKIVAVAVVAVVAILGWWAYQEMKPKMPPLPVTISYDDTPAEPTSEDPPVPAPEAPPVRVALPPEEQAQAEAIPRGAITGRVYDARTGVGVQGVPVQANAWSPDKAAFYERVFGRPSERKQDKWPGATTDASGRYTIPDAVAGVNMVNLKYAGLAGYPRKSRWVANVKVEPGSSTGGVDFALERGMAISGRVIDERNQPVAAAKVWSQPTWSAPSEDTRNQDETETDDQGRFEIFGIEPNSSAKISAQSDAVATMEPVAVSVGESDVTDVVLEAKRTASVAGTAVDRQGRPLAGWYVLTYGKVKGGAGEIRSNGAFEVTGISAGKCSMSIGPRPGSPLYRAGDIELDPGQRLTGLRLTCTVGRPITGRVVAPDGKPAPSVYVTVAGPRSHNSVQTDDKGEFSVYTSPDDDTFTLSVTMSTLGRAEVKDVASGTQGVEILLQGYGKIQGRVVDAQTGQPLPVFEMGCRSLPEFRQWCLAPDGSSLGDLTALGFVRQDDPEGRFKLDYADTQNGMGIVARAAGHVPAYVEVQPGQTNDVVLRLKPGAAVEGIVVNAQGAPVSGAYILEGSDPGPVYWQNHAEMRTDAQGRFHIDSLPLDPITLFAAHPDYSTGSAAVTPNAGAPARVTITLAQGGRVEGTVRAAGKPVSHARVTLADVPRTVPVYTGQDGRYFMGNVYSGTVTVMAEVPLPRQRLLRTATVEHGAVTTVDFDFGGAGAVEGTITTAANIDGAIRVVLQAESPAGTQMLTADAEGANGTYTYRIDQAPAGPCTVAAGFEARTGWHGAAPIHIEVPEDGTVRQDFVIGGAGSVAVEVSGAREGEVVAIGVLRGTVDTLDLSGISSPEELLPRLLDRILAGATEPPYEFSGLEPGTHTLAAVAFPADRTSPPRYTLTPLEVPDGSPVHASIELR